MADVKTVKIFLLSAGIRGNEAAKELSYLYYNLTAEEAENQPEIDFEKRNSAGYGKLKWSVGTIVEIDAIDEKGTKIYGKGQFKGRWQDQKILTQWKSYETAWQAWWDEMKVIRKNKLENPLNDTLEPIRKAYWDLPAIQRAQLLAKVVAFIAKRP